MAPRFRLRGVSLETALAMLATGESGARPLAVITFDDGFRDFYTTAWPIIQRHGFTATMYLPTRFYYLAAEIVSRQGMSDLERGA